MRKPTVERRVVADTSFEGFYRRYFPRAVALAHALAGSRAAEDIAQEALWATFKRWDDRSYLVMPPICSATLIGKAGWSPDAQ